MFQVTLKRVQDEMIILLNKNEKMSDDMSYLFGNIQEFSKLADGLKMKLRLEKLIDVFFKNAKLAVESKEKVKFEKDFLVKKLIESDFIDFKYFDIQKLIDKEEESDDESQIMESQVKEINKNGIENSQLLEEINEKLEIYSISEHSNEKIDISKEENDTKNIFKSFAGKREQINANKPQPIQKLDVVSEEKEIDEVKVL